MDRAETLKIMAVLKANYPRYYIGLSREEAEAAANLWQMQFSADRYEQVSTAVMAFISGDTKGSPPVIGQIKEALHKINHPGEPTELEAWLLVKKALRNSGYEAAQEFKKLPADIQSVLGSPATLREWCVMDDDEVNTVIASNFQRSYRAKAAQVRERDALPEAVRVFIGGMNLPQLES